MSFYEDAWAFCVSINKIATHTHTRGSENEGPKEKYLCACYSKCKIIAGGRN